MTVDSPMMQQYRRVKAEVGDAILLFRLGDFYEMFNDDAVTASRVLDITLTARGREQGSGGFPMCGVPFQAMDGHVARLVQAGHRVAVCDQVEAPAGGRGVMRRELVRIVTPGTATDDRNLRPSESSFLSAILLERGRVGLAHVDVSTGEFRFSEHDPASEREIVTSQLATFAPREVIAPEGCDRAALAELFRGSRMPPVAEVDAATFSRQHAKESVAQRWKVASLGAFGLDARPAAARAVGAALAYLEHTQRADLSHLEPPRHSNASDVVGVDAVTRRNLELTESLRDGSRHATLVAVLDRTVTAMGSRTLRSWILAPLRDVGAIDERLDAVGEMKDGFAETDGLVEMLRGVSDLERLLARVVLGSATPRDVVAIGRSLAALPALAQGLSRRSSALLVRLAGEVEPLPGLTERIARALVDMPPAVVREGGFVREGFSAELDELRSIARDARAHLARVETRERERTGIASLKVRHNKVFGYYLEVSNANREKVPGEWQRKQTLAGAERFVTPELKELETKILHAQERSVQLESEVFAELRAAVAERVEEIRRSARALGAVDALASYALVAASHGYCRPRVDESTALEIRGGRHPVVERMDPALVGAGLGSGRFVPNDTDLDAAARQLVIITGPNMGGKSTYLRQVALIALMAQAGSFVPADAARIGVVDKIFTRVGASDSLATGQSTFMVEMSETARILHEATSRSLVVLDEIGRGTATFDGLSIAWAVAEYLHETSESAARTLFATHYHELTELATLYPRVKNMRMATREWKGDIVFLHRIEEGAGDRSYGIQVARLAGLPQAVIARAKEVLENLLRSELDPSGEPRLARHEGPEAGRRSSRRSGPSATSPQLPLFGQPSEDPRLRALARRLADVDVDGLAPRGALDLLAELHAEAKRVVE